LGLKKNPLPPVKQKRVFKPKISKQNYTGEVPLTKAAIQQQQLFAQRAVILFEDIIITQKITPNKKPKSSEMLIIDLNTSVQDKRLKNYFDGI